MNAFLYFVPGVNAVSAADLATLGLGYAFLGTVNIRAVMEGPGKRSGVVVSPVADEVRFDAAAQTWIPAPDKTYWVGMVNGAAPSPRELERPEAVIDWRVTLPGGSVWSVPTVLGADGESGLPKFRRYDEESGKIVRRVRQEYQPLLLAADEALESIRKRQPLGEEKELALFADILAVNYRVALPELMLLELTSDTAMLSVFSAALYLQDSDGLEG